MSDNHRVVSDFNMSKSKKKKNQVRRVALLFKQCRIICINRFSHLNNAD